MSQDRNVTSGMVTLLVGVYKITVCIRYRCWFQKYKTWILQGERNR